MSEHDKLLDEMKRLSNASNSSNQVDSKVENSINAEKRSQLLEKLLTIDDKLKKEIAKGPLSDLDKPLVWSHLSSRRDERLIQEIEVTDLRLKVPFKKNNPNSMNARDNRYDRTLTFDEYSERFDALTKSISQGKLDDYLGLPAEDVIHRIMGLSGELLGRLGIDPKKGETYQIIYGTQKESAEIVGIFRADEPGVLELPLARTRSEELGIRCVNLSSEIVKHMRLNLTTRGVLIVDVFKDSIAEKWGLRAGSGLVKVNDETIKLGGDVITAVDFNEVNNVNEFNKYLNKKTSKSILMLTILRNGNTIVVTLPF